MIICGTGHRPNKLGGYGPEVHAKLIKLAVAFFDSEEGASVKRVISGMALGWDQALARAAIKVHIPYTAAVPFVGMQDKWPRSSQAEYIDLLCEAYSIHYVSKPPYAAYKMQLRNEWMVDHADAVLALWDGSEGGTGNCIRYAQKKGKRIINLWEQYEQH